MYIQAEQISLDFFFQQMMFEEEYFATTDGNLLGFDERSFEIYDYKSANRMSGAIDCSKQSKQCTTQYTIQRTGLTFAAMVGGLLQAHGLLAQITGKCHRPTSTSLLSRPIETGLATCSP